MAKTKPIKKTTKKPTHKHKSIGPKFCAVILIFVLALFMLVGNIILLHSVRDEMKTSFNYELRSAVETLTNNIDTVYDFAPSDSGKTLALKMVNDATWNDERRHFWASNDDYTEILAGQKDYETFYSVAEQETKFGFKVLAGYDEDYFNTYAYPNTENFVRVSTAITMLIALLALGACAIAFRRSSSQS